MKVGVCVGETELVGDTAGDGLGETELVGDTVVACVGETELVGLGEELGEAEGARIAEA